MKVADLQSIRIKLASPETILSWSFGEVLKPETVNYRTLRPERDGLFCEKIFGPTKDFQCYCGKYRRIRYKGIICDRCGVEVTQSSVRRERMGHIKLACPCSHIWFLRGMPSSLGQALDISREKLEKVVYFAAYIITSVSKEGKAEALERLEREYERKIKALEKQADQKGLKNGLNKRQLNTTLRQLKETKEKAVKELEKVQPLGVLLEVEYREASLKYGEIFEAETGAEALFEIVKKIDLKKEITKLEEELTEASASSKHKIFQRLRFFKGMDKAKTRPEWMFLTILPVLPPDLRPMVPLDGGRYASSDLNDLYRRVINRNNRLKYLLEISAPEVIVRNEKRMLQEAVDALIDNSMRTATVTRATTGGTRLLKSLADMLKGKKGRFRRNLLGKRVDYSGRSVIVVGPELKLHQVGLPKEMALELFRPFVIKKIRDQELAYNVRGASRLIDEKTDEILAILEEVVKDKFVLLNRAPTLHRISIQAFQPVLIEGKAIRIHPLVCQAYNADFDGDQMAVHVPLSKEAQKEAKELMLASRNLLKPASGWPITVPYQDIVLGCYWMTKIIPGLKGEGKTFASFQEALLAYEMEKIDLRAKIRVAGISKAQKEKNGLLETSAGRIIFNQVLPDDFPFQNKVLKSKDLEETCWEVVERYGLGMAPTILDKIKELGFEYSTLSGISLGMDDFIVPPQKKEILERGEEEVAKINDLHQKGLLANEERRERILEVWARVKSEIEKLLPQILPPDGPVFSIADSGCRGTWMQPAQMAGMRGLVMNPLGEIIELPIKSSYKEGLGVLEYFISTHGARKGTADTAMRTSTAGYLTRRLIDVSHEVLVTQSDCGDKKGSLILLADAKAIDQDFLFKIVGRVSLEDIKDSRGKMIIKKGGIISWTSARTIVKEEIGQVRVRSPLSCQSLRGVCQKCYGWDLGRNELVRLGEAVGVVAAQSMGEPGTQLTLRTFHTGGAASAGDITVGLPRVDEVFEARPPKGEAVISRVDGEVVNIKGRVIEIKAQEKGGKKSGEVSYRIPVNLDILAKTGQKIGKGQMLSEGSINLKEFFKLKGKEESGRYIIQEIQKIYVSQGVTIHDKHIEVIVRQMFSRVKIKSPGDSLFSPGEIVEKATFLEINEELKSRGQKPAIASDLVLGVSEVALTTDSFLSAASFQQTSRVLIRAALEGKEDRLKGLKENVVIGKLIPAGTGFREKGDK